MNSKNKKPILKEINGLHGAAILSARADVGFLYPLNAQHSR